MMQLNERMIYCSFFTPSTQDTRTTYPHKITTISNSPNLAKESSISRPTKSNISTVATSSRMKSNLTSRPSFVPTKLSSVLARVRNSPMLRRAIYTTSALLVLLLLLVV